MLHVTFDSVTREEVRSTRPGEDVGCINDNLLIGPCHVDPARHRARRITYCEHWDAGAVYGLDDVVVAAPAVCLWVSGLASEVAMWRACALLRRAGRRRAIVVRAGHPVATSGAREATLWTAFAASTPLPLQAARRQCPALWTYYTGFFPRLDAGLRLSAFDELVLRAVAESEWSTALHMVTRTSLVDELWRWLFLTGDLLLPMRLDEWVQRGGLEVREAGTGSMDRREYRMTDKGAAMLAGLPRVTDAPPMPIGGAVAYRGARAWVVRPRGRIGRIAGAS